MVRIGERVRRLFVGLGAELARAWAKAVERARGGVVEVLDGDAAVALGTVVTPDGHVLTKASELPMEQSFRPRCRLINGRLVDGKMVGVSAAYDLALLKGDATGLRPVEWADGERDTSAGTLIAAPVPSLGDSVVWGLVSVALRELPGPHPTWIAPRCSRPTRRPHRGDSRSRSPSPSNPQSPRRGMVGTGSRAG